MIALPSCRWRQEPSRDNYLCTSAKFVNAPNPVRAAFCAECPYVDHPDAPPIAPALPCVHLGDPADDGKRNGGGRRNKEGEVFACAIHDRCTVDAVEGTETGSAHCCAGCGDYLARDPFGANSLHMRRLADAYLAA